jgi:hypothetical protein
MSAVRLGNGSATGEVLEGIEAPRRARYWPISVGQPHAMMPL